ncbi:hypothetical protein DV737_g4254, partial [Chaetothyriales sp. CBS 132003]
MVSLVVVGACYLDTILTVPYYPHEDEKLRAESLSQRRGGNGPNSLELLAQLITARRQLEALSLLLCSVLPAEHSPAVDLIKASLGPAVDLSTCIYREGRTEAASSYIIQSVGSGSRTVVNYNDLPEMSLKEFEHVCEKAGPTGKWYHFEGRIPDVVLGCIRHLRRKPPGGITVSVEVEKPGRAGLEELAAEADVVFYSQSWAKVFKGSLLFCTWGADGSAAWRRGTGDIAEAPAFKLEGKPLVELVNSPPCTFSPLTVIPYVPPQDDAKPDFGSTFTSTMPMAAMFTRNRAIGCHNPNSKPQVLRYVSVWQAGTRAPATVVAQQAPALIDSAALALIVSAAPADPFAEADDDTGETKQAQNYIHIRIQQRNGRKTLTTVQGLPKKFDQKKILKVIKKKFACNGTIVTDSEMGEVIQLQGDQRKDVQEFLVAKDGLELDAKTIKSSALSTRHPRVAVVLGVDHVWYIPLLLCRGLSITSAIWWACITLLNIDEIWDLRLQHGPSKGPDGVGAQTAAGRDMLCHRLLIAQVGLSFVWTVEQTVKQTVEQTVKQTVKQTVEQTVKQTAGTSAYLAHLFASSLMSRWLLHYSPLAVLLRLCSLSILLSYVCRELLRSLGATQPDLVALSRSLPIWIVIAIALLIIYFSTQHDISLEHDKDDRRRRLVLRMKCLYAMAISSLSSLLIVIALIHSSTASWEANELPSWIPDCLRAGGQDHCLNWIYAREKTEL